jgi:hypothetical protein
MRLSRGAVLRACKSWPEKRRPSFFTIPAAID